MNYLEARPLIQVGDLVFFGKSKKVFSQLESLWTGSPYTHVAIAFRIPLGKTDRVFVVEEHAGGQRIVNMSSEIEGRTSTLVMKAPVEWDLYGDELLTKTGAVDYAYINLISIGLREKFGLKLKASQGEVCSEMVARVLRANGVRLPTNQVSPGLLLRQLLDQGCQKRLEIDSI